jgi:hypothetical protein
MRKAQQGFKNIELFGSLLHHMDMGRPKNFRREEVLEKAIPVFWKRGFSDTSVQDLERATGVNKSGLYSRKLYVLHRASHDQEEGRLRPDALRCPERELPQGLPPVRCYTGPLERKQTQPKVPKHIKLGV